VSTLLDAARTHPRRASAVAIALGGGLALLLGWLGASDAVYTAQQVPYLISGGLGGLFLLGLATTLWVSEDLRDQAGEIEALMQLARSLAPGATDADAAR